MQMERVTADACSDAMTFIYELDSYPMEIYRMCKNELSTSRLSKVVLRKYRNTTEIIYHATSRVDNNIILTYADYLTMLTHFTM